MEYWVLVAFAVFALLPCGGRRPTAVTTGLRGLAGLLRVWHFEQVEEPAT